MKLSSLLHFYIELRPELALEPDISARIMIEGMTRGCSSRGDFTGVSLEDYFNNHTEDEVNARRIVNGMDQANGIAGLYRKFLEALKIAVVAALLLLVGCKPSQLVTEKIITRTDSSAVQVLRDSFYRKDIQMAFLHTDLKRARVENIRFRSETRQHEIHYDLTASVDTSTGKRPVMSEIITSTDNRYGKEVEDDERRSAEAFMAHENLTYVNRSQLLTVEKQTLEDKTLKEEPPASRSRYKLFMAGVVVGIILGVAAGFLLRGI